MILSSLSAVEVRRRLRGPGLLIRTGPFNFRILSAIESVAQGLILLYADYPLVDDGEFIDFTVTLAPSGGLRRLWRPQVRFLYDGESPFAVLPMDHAFPLLEWAMNWCISTQAHHYLTLHAAVMEREGCAVIMPAPPGSGKSTLCAGLVNRGWRLLSDELTLISLTDGLITPLGRPVSLKNQSLAVIRNFVPRVVMNQVTHDTSKGSVSHMKVPTEHVQRLAERARPRWVIFPKYVSDAPAELTQRSKANSMLELGRNSFNYTVLGLTGFEVLSNVISVSDCFDFRYSQLEDAVAVFDNLVAKERG
ncbi:HprK-related kinase A [Rhodoferax sp.]|uniref:HprK-related kinase A n=1 Tax=Rhodoferax sp. TaxID=50421 RepID=UPI001ECDD48E|nr:HprK-related kinase A [Rhodoferax sp.]MBT9505844.1 HprK-related kinase A [Rhodoferax sp.]